MESYFPLGNR